MSSAPNRLVEIAPDRLSKEQTLLMEKLVRERGRVPTPFKIWLHSPVLANCLNDLGIYIARGTSLAKSEAEIAVLILAAHWRADYVFAMHRKEAREAGLAVEVIDAIEGNGDSLSIHGALDDRQRCIHRLVRAFTERRTVPDDDFLTAAHELGHAGIADVLALCGYFTSVALAMKLYQVS